MKGAFPAERGVLSVAVMEEVLRGEDVRALRVWCSLPIGSELCQKIIIVCPALRACEEVVKESTGAVVVFPEYREIVLHFSLSPLQSVTPSVLP